jgi:preprotein translocase subunit SecD
MNRYPLWKYAILLAALLVGFFYSLPNYFGQSPALQIGSSKNNIKIDQNLLLSAAEILKADNITATGSVLQGDNITFKFADPDTQLKAQIAVQKKLGDQYTVALNSVSNSPDWLTAINAHPMYLGLDLRGGVHFLLQVDMKGALETAAKRVAGDAGVLLRGKSIKYVGLTQDAQVVTIRFRDDAERKKASKEILESNGDVAIREAGSGEELSLVVSLKDEAKKKIQDQAVQQNMTVLRNRTNALGVAEPIIQQQGADRIVVQLPGVQDASQAESVLGRTATLELRPVNEDTGALEAAVAGNVPFGSELFTERDGRPVLVRKQVILTGERIVDAQPAFDSRSNEPIIRVSTDGPGGRILKDHTRENLKKRMAIMLVEKNKSECLLSPTIQDELSTNFQISGRMSSKETNELSLLIRAGSLAAPIEIIEKRTIGPSLGKENIERGFKSVWIGLAALSAFIIAYYMIMGIISTTALIVNLLLLIAVLSMLQATLTLPGIAAIALTLGMAIDSNVLINERIREELRGGAKPQEAINAGFERAWGTILDSNVTTLIAGVALLLVGSGPVRGFAVVHCLGILTSMFSAVFFARGLVNLYYGSRKKLDKMSIGQIWKGGQPATAVATLDNEKASA